ncbi:SAM hydrolase/SAM-dependent halogenase family protein [Psittacicella gerlachiana]|uniref:DNA-directed RNA polymerase subunit delta n=1 Tax=Psittacicella gerlachiana TaxID=2028574 RepID=A0A3A1YB24_9GAMM|nr:S-adenosyl-l-methionine hydroxide adenosyltransferase family protein [Psittacicella gerlachiana]RIY34378.1 DNA-directed RNA polymerase subunit delta [Psittacicella gerlachiana]
MSKNALVLQTDFGLGDGAVSAMYGVAAQVDPELRVHDLTHDIPPYDIWAASYRLLQTVPYWPKGTVFVSVVDPGVGSTRRSFAARTKKGQIIITPDNGTLSHLAHYIGLEEVRLIDEVVSRLPHSGESHTFHGRDVYAYNGARLASGEITFAEIGSVVELEQVTRLPIVDAKIENQVACGIIDILDIRFGSLWTNIPLQLLRDLEVKNGDNLVVSIYHNGIKVYQNVMTFAKVFSDVNIGEPLVYINSLLNVGVAVNQDSFSRLYHIGTGVEWSIELRKSQIAQA